MGGKKTSDELVEKCRAYCELLESSEAFEVALEAIKRLDRAAREKLKSRL